MAGPDLVARIDQIMAELAELRAAVAVRNVTGGSAESADNDDVAVRNVTTADDLAPENLIEISTAAARWNRPPDTVRHWCRREGCGVKVGGRWLASVPRVERRRRLNGG